VIELASLNARSRSLRLNRQTFPSRVPGMIFFSASRLTVLRSEALIRKADEHCSEFLVVNKTSMLLQFNTQILLS
jgi:hypothetical protein